MDVRIETLSSVEGIAHRGIGDYAESAPRTWRELWDWTNAKDLVPQVRGAIGYGLDNPMETPAEALRYDAVLVFEGAPEGEPGFEKTTVPGGRYALHTLVGPYHGMPAVFGRLFGEWLPGSGELFDETRPCLEIYLNDPMEVPESELRTDLCIPLKG